MTAAELEERLSIRVVQARADRATIGQLQTTLSITETKLRVASATIGRQAGEIARLQDDLKLAVEQMRVYQAQTRLVGSGSRRAG
jgi:hypothetical protein